MSSQGVTQLLVDWGNGDQAADPTNLTDRYNQAGTHTMIGDLLFNMGDAAGALEGQRRALAMRAELARIDPVAARRTGAQFSPTCLLIRNGLIACTNSRCRSENCWKPPALMRAMILASL